MSCTTIKSMWGILKEHNLWNSKPTLTDQVDTIIFVDKEDKDTKAAL